jgi:thiol:disulfide interchange protein DsbD
MIPITSLFRRTKEVRISKTLVCVALRLGLLCVLALAGVCRADRQFVRLLLQSRFVVGAVAVVLLLLALSMLGAFTIQPPRFLLARSGAKKGAAGALAMGALLGIVAAPCVGPVVAALLLYVGEQRSPQLGLFSSLRYRLVWACLICCWEPSAAPSNHCPKRHVLERSKKIFAIPLLLAALYYGYSAAKPAHSQERTQWANATATMLEERSWRWSSCCARLPR